MLCCFPFVDLPCRVNRLCPLTARFGVLGRYHGFLHGCGRLPPEAVAWWIDGLGCQLSGAETFGRLLQSPSSVCIF